MSDATPSTEELLALVAIRPPTPEKCAVCLNAKPIDDISSIDACRHTFCFPCIREWSKVRAICPLCKQPFTMMTRTRYGGDLVEEVKIETAPAPTPMGTSFTNLNEVLSWVNQHTPFSSSTRHNDENMRRSRSSHDDQGESHELFRQMMYLEWLNTLQSLVGRSRTNTNVRTTTTISSSSSANHHTTTSYSSSWSQLIPAESIRRLLQRYLHQTTVELHEASLHSRSTRQTVAFRKYIYLNRLFVHTPLAAVHDNTMTIRECSPQWYSSNPACLHRLVPFLARELLALLWNDARTIERLIQEILAIIQQHDIRSRHMARKLNSYLGRFTKHFIHEFHTYAQCPFDLTGFDRHARYPSAPISSLVRCVPPPPLHVLDDDDDQVTDTILLDALSDDDRNDQHSQANTATARERNSSSPDGRDSLSDVNSECEIIDFIQPVRERTPTPSFIVLSEDEEDTEDKASSLTSTHARSPKRKRHHRRRHSKRSGSRGHSKRTRRFSSVSGAQQQEEEAPRLASVVTVIGGIPSN